MTSEFPAQMARNAENVSISWCHHAYDVSDIVTYRQILQWMMKISQGGDVWYNTNIDW